MDKEKLVRIVTKSVYGKELLYVVSEHCQSISQLTGRKTVCVEDIRALVGLGLGVSLADSLGNVRYSALENI